MDLDATGSVVGIEIVGATEFTIKALLEKTPLHIDEVERIDETRYVPATGHA